MRGWLTAILAGATALTALAQGSATGARTTLAQANAALQAGEADKALALLRPMTTGSEPQGEVKERALAHNLACRVYLILERWDRAANECEQAVRDDGSVAEYHMWLGRALGERASRASFMSAYSLSKRVRAEFEEAVRLDPHDAEALADLGEFYFQAPSIIGGGQDKAEGVARQMDTLDPARALELRAKIAEEHKDLGAAEREIKQAVSVGSHPAFQWMGLAGFYKRHQRWTEMESAVQSGYHAAERDKHSGVALYDGANLLLHTGRDTALAAKMMEGYLANPVKTEEAPAFVAHLQLAQLKEQLGDPAAAQRERLMAQSMAHEYHPAQEPRH